LAWSLVGARWVADEGLSAPDGIRVEPCRFRRLLFVVVTILVGVEDIDATISEVTRLGGSIVQEPSRVPGVAFALIADPAGQVIGLAQQG
jgi:predicted enzyme related to lactoylglutathione lyase